MSLLDLNLASIVISELNEKIKQQLSYQAEIPVTEDFLSLNSDGKDHSIIFLGKDIWSSKLENLIENIPLEIEMELNTKKRFEKHLRMLIMDRINILKYLEL